MEFSFSQTDPGLFLIEKVLSTKKQSHGSDISGPYWMLVEIKIHHGQIWWVTDHIQKCPRKKKMFIFLPSFSWAMEHYAANTQIGVKGLISRTKIQHPDFPGPVLFYSNRPFPKGFSQVVNLLNSINQYEKIGACTNPSSLSARAKKILDVSYNTKVEIGDIAIKLKTNPAVLSRTFKADFGETPTFYRKGLRTTVGMHELMMGVPPLKAAHLAGYSDLGRFYKQFKSYLKQTPAQYLDKSKNAKTGIRQT